jgi:hypothetical protein
MVSQVRGFLPTSKAETQLFFTAKTCMRFAKKLLKTTKTTAILILLSLDFRLVQSWSQINQHLIQSTVVNFVYNF